MKRILLITGIALTLFASCVREYNQRPIADFSASYTLVTPGEVVFFTNSSQYVGSCIWYFGDGTTSTEFSPSHYYSQEGSYQVELEVHNDGFVDYSYLTIDVYETTLEVEVRDYVTNELVPYVDITLFDTYQDWKDLVFPVISGTTDRYGSVVFKGLDTKSYYIDAYSTFYDNEQLGFDDIGFIETLPLLYATHNVFTAYVDYYPGGKMNPSGQRMRTPEIKELKRAYKERKTEVK
jgi:PKD repeat protein